MSRRRTITTPLHAMAGILCGLPSGSEQIRFFSQVFKRHRFRAIREALYTRPEPQSPPAPWLYTRVLTLGLLIAAAGIASASRLGEYSACIVIPAAALVVPLSTYVLMTELNTARDLAPWRTLLYATLITSLTTLPASAAIPTPMLGFASFVEEPAKFLTALLLAWQLRLRLNRPLRGIALGCAVGASFSFPENVLYMLNTYTENGYDAMLTTALLRLICDTFAHTTWTGMAVGAYSLALCRREHAAEQGESAPPPLLAWSFLRVFFTAMLLHFLFNSMLDAIRSTDNTPVKPLLILFLPFGVAAIGYLSWSIIMRLVAAGLEHETHHPSPRESAPAKRPRLFCISLSGSVSRGEYSLICLVYFLLGALLIIGSELAPNATSLQTGFYLALIAYLPITALCGTAATACRLRDAGHSSRWVIILIPFIYGSLFLLGLILACAKSKTASEEGLTIGHV